MKDNKSKKMKMKPGKAFSENKVPLDYIVIIDSGSKGSRVFIYNWLNPKYIFENNLDLHYLDDRQFKLLKRIDILEKLHGSRDGKEASASEMGPSISQNEDENEKRKPIRILEVLRGKKWYKKIKPGISSFQENPQKLGSHHLEKLLDVATRIVPKSEHHRTPIFLHSTAGMRLLPFDDQQKILDSICSYIQTKSSFYLPDCASHINVIDGDVEGLYGWLSINSLMGSLDRPEEHDHGKNHTTYGVLDMGGASTQVVFQPNSTEIEDHQNNLFKIKLSGIPYLVKNNPSYSSEVIGNYTLPEEIKYSVYSDSFLGFGMSQAHARYLSLLVKTYRKEHNLNEENGYLGGIHVPVPDPCLPKGYTKKDVVDGYSVDFTGESNFEKCLNAIFPVILTSSYSSVADNGDENCKSLTEYLKFSSCLYNDLKPAFDFGVNHFVGVSGYWDAINTLLNYESPIEQMKREKNAFQDISNSYDYKLIYTKTSRVCDQSLSSLIELNNAKPKKQRMSEEELSNLCFQSSWILNFLHIGLNMPRLGIDDVVEESRFKSLQIVDKFGGTSFSWTLGRAILYSNDEFTQAFNNYTIDTLKLARNEDIDEERKKYLIDRSGFYHTASPSVFHPGSEEYGIGPRPEFSARYIDSITEDTVHSTTSHMANTYNELHHNYGLIFLFSFFVLLVCLLMSRNRRIIFLERMKNRQKTILKDLTNYWPFSKNAYNYKNEVIPNSLRRPFLDPESIEMNDFAAGSTKDLEQV